MCTLSYPLPIRITVINFKHVTLKEANSFRDLTGYPYSPPTLLPRSEASSTLLARELPSPPTQHFGDS